MRKYLLFILVLIMYTSIYAQKSRVFNVKKNTVSGYTISGTVEGHGNGDTVYICELKYLYLVPEDSAIIRNGKFHFKGKTDKAKLRCIVASMHKNPIICPFILSNEKFDVKVMKNPELSTVTGSHDNDLWSEYNNHESEIRNRCTNNLNLVKGVTPTMAQRNLMKEDQKNYQREDSAYTVKFLMDKLPSGTSDVLLEMAMPLNETTMQTILDKMGKVCPKDVLYMSLMQKRKVARETSAGRRYTDLIMNDPEGNPIKLSDYVSKNKVTMIDFWASWCGPCRAEMPNIVKAYKQYKDKGFAIIGVSFDNKLDAWKGAIESLGITWPQMSDLKGWKSKGASAYDIEAVPAAVLIDQSGKIIARDLRGDKLENKLAELFK